MDISGRFSRVSDTDYRDGIVLVGFLGNVYPHSLRPEDIAYIKVFYHMPGSKHEFFNVWPEGIEPRYPAAKTNFRNGYMLLRAQKEV